MYSDDNIQYAIGRLVDTIIRYKDVAVEVSSILGREGGLHVYSLGVLDNKAYEDHIDAYDLTPVPLGFVNYTDTNKVGYASRIPIRQDWRQGLRENNARCLWGESWWNRKDIARTIEGRFPPLSFLRNTLSGAEAMGAWCRDFAVDGASRIYYRAEGVVGKFEGDTYLLDAPFTWVEESLKEELNGYV